VVLSQEARQDDRSSGRTRAPRGGRLASKSGCEFISEFAELFPISVFLDLMAWPHEMFDRFREWNFTLIHGEDPEVRARQLREITRYLRGLIAERRGVVTDDLTSVIVNAQVDGWPLTDDECLGMLILLFGGGLDTVTAVLGLHFAHLARHPELQDHLRKHPEDISATIDELLRFLRTGYEHPPGHGRH